jgi:hypothetical protein
MSIVLDDAPAEAVDANEGRALALVTPTENLAITEVLDALPKDIEGNAITNIAPLKYDLTDALLAGLKSEYAGAIFAVDTPEGKKAAKEIAGKLSKLSKGMDDAYKDWNAPIMAMTKNAREQKDYAQGVIGEILKPIKQQLDDQKAKEEAEEVARAAAESRRVDAHTAALIALQSLPDQYVMASSADIDAAIREVSSFEYLTRRNWEEFAPPAQDAQRVGIEKLKTHLQNAKDREELARLRAEQTKKDAEAAAQREAREAADREAAEARERTEALKERIRNIETAPMGAFGTSVTHMAKLIGRLDATDLSAFGDMQPEAEKAIATARAMIVSMQTQQKAVEDAAVVAQQNAANLQRLQDEKAGQERAEADRVAAAERAEQQRKDEAAVAEREAAAQRERDEQAASERTAQAAAEAKTRAESVAQTLLALLLEARQYVIGSSDSVRPGLIAEIDAAISAATPAQGE